MLRIINYLSGGNPGSGLFDGPPTNDCGTPGEEGKQAGLALLKLHRPQLGRAGRWALTNHLLEHARAFGVVPAVLVKLGIILSAGNHQTLRREAHCHPVRLWRHVAPLTAMEWLENNTELRQPAGGAA